MVQFHQETAAAERVSLDHLQAGRVRPVQPHFQRILTVRQPVFVLFGAKLRVMIGRGRVVQRQQTGLSDENVRSAILEQLKGLVRLLHRFRIGAQPDPA